MSRLWFNPYVFGTGIPAGTVFGLFASPSTTGAWNSLTYTITNNTVNATLPQNYYGTGTSQTVMWDAGGAYQVSTGLPNGVNNSTLPGTSILGSWSRVAFNNAVRFTSFSIGLYGSAVGNPIDTIAIYGGNSATGPWTTLFSGASGVTNTNYNTGLARFITFNLTTTGNFTHYVAQITKIQAGFGNNPITGCIYFTV